VNPVNPAISAGAVQQFTATGTFSGYTYDVTQSVTWSSTKAKVATVSIAAGSKGLATGVTAGTTTIKATSGSISGSTTLTVNPSLASIAVTPAAASIALGTSQQYTATGTYSDGSQQNLTSSVIWASSATSVATVNAGGVANSVATGSATISASLGAVSGFTTLSVTPAALVSLAVTPANGSISLGTTLQIKATGTYTDGSTLDVTNSVVWNSGATNVATISNAVGTQGLASSVAVGSATITATSGSISGNTNLTVTAAVLTTIVVTPAIPSIPLGTTQQFNATGTFSDKTTQDLTASVQWSSSQTSVATISNASGSQGLASSAGTGTSTVTATSGSVSGSSTVTVTAASLVSISIAPANIQIALGNTQSFTATGTFSDNSTQDLTASVTWTSSNTGVATISSTGLAASAAAGNTTISATSGTTTGTTSLTVTAAVLSAIVVNPATASIPLGTTQQFTATGTFSDSSTQDVTATAHWSSSDGTLATVSNTSGSQGLASTVAPGSVSITATSGSISGSGSLTVTAAALVSIAITPANPTIPLGTSQQFFATGSYTDGTTQDITAVVTWASTLPSVAVVSNASGSQGLATSTATGTTAVSATLGTVASSTNLTVSAASLTSIVVAPATASIPAGSTQQFTASGSYTDGSTEDLTASAVWSVQNSSVATISNAAGSQGLAAGVAGGSTNVTATVTSINSSANLTVTMGAATLNSITVTPTVASIGTGAAQSFKATGYYSDGSTQDLTTLVTWGSSHVSVATISNTAGSQGTATAVATGSTTISGTSNGITGSAVLTVANTPCSGPCVLSYHYDLARDGVTGAEQILTPANVNSSTFGRVASITSLNGQIYAQPLYMSGLSSVSSNGNVVFVATEQDYVYAFDADTYNQIWGNSYIPAGEAPLTTGTGVDSTCTNITPNMGITGTPVIDPNTTFNPNPVMYFVTKSVDGSKNYHQRLHAVDVVTGMEVFGGPVEITTPVGSSEIFDPLRQNQRSGLALTYDVNLQPQIYIAWGSHCDQKEYHGWVMKFNVNSGVLGSAPGAYFLSTNTIGAEGGIWMGGGAPAVDNSTNGNLYVVVGNGNYDGVANWGNTIVKLNSNLQVADWYTPNDWSCLDGITNNANCPADKDLGSGGVVLFNVFAGVPELVTAGKTGEFYVIYQQNMGRLDPSSPLPNFAPPATCTTGPPYPTGGPSDIAQCFPGIAIPASGAGGSRSTPAFWNNTLYAAGSSDALRAFSLSASNIGTFNTTPAVATSPTTFSYPGSAAVVSWNGIDPGTGVLWALQDTGYVPPAKSFSLRAYTAVPNGSGLTALFQSTTGPGSIKFQVPTVANGKVFVAGQGFSAAGTEGQLYVYGLCPCK
jgi:hypothetical protein